MTVAMHHSSSQPSPMTRQAEFLYVLELTTTMLDAACKEDWGYLQQLVPIRQSYLNEFFAKPTALEDVPWIRQGIQRILTLDKKLVDICHGAQKTLAKTKNDLALGKKARQTYSSFNKK